MTHQTKRRLTFLAGFVFYFGALGALWDTAFVYPLKIFVVLLHEISHAAVAVATGGTIERIVLDPNQGGACYCPGGSAFLTLSAGYLGSLGWGGLMVTAGQSSRISTRWVVGAIGHAHDDPRCTRFGDAGFHGLEHAPAQVVAMQSHARHARLQLPHHGHGRVFIEVVHDQDLVIGPDVLP